MELCTNGGKHVFRNSWGSLYHHNYCGICSCLRTVTPHELSEALKNNECYAETMLIEQLEYHSNPKNFRPTRRYDDHK